MSNRPSKTDLFKGRYFEQEIIILCVRWYLRYKLSYRDLVEIMAERGLPIAHTTILRWVRCYAPEFDKRWSRFSAQAGKSWRVDKTYVRIRGQWAYLYRAVDAAGKTVDFRLSPRRNVASAKAFFRKAVRSKAGRRQLLHWTAMQPPIVPFANFNNRYACRADDTSLVKIS